MIKFGSISKTYSSIFVVILLFFSNVAIAKVDDPTSFAVTAAVHGDVKFVAAGKSTSVPINSGHFIRPGDKLTTGKNSGLQVLLSDGTVFTLGDNTIFGLDKYTYDPGMSTGEIRARIEMGTFRVVTGRIGETNPGSVSVLMPTGLVSLRGTIIAGESDGETDTVVLLGPGAQKNSADKKGSFAFIPKGAAVQTAEDEILVFKAGYAVTVDAEGNVSEPSEMSGREFGQLVSTLVKERGGLGHLKDSDDDSASELADADDGIEEEDDLLVADEDTEELAEEGEHDEMDDVAALIEAQDVTKLTDLEDIAGLKGKFVETELEMENGGTFDFRFEFGSVESAKLDYIGFENINTEDGEAEDGSAIAGVVDGEVSWDVAVDGEPTFEELDLSLEDETLTSKECDQCESAEITVLNAGQGNVAKFFILALDTGNDIFEEAKIVKPGGNNNFPGSE